MAGWIAIILCVIALTVYLILERRRIKALRDSVAHALFDLDELLNERANVMPALADIVCDCTERQVDIHGPVSVARNDTYLATTVPQRSFADGEMGRVIAGVMTGTVAVKLNSFAAFQLLKETLLEQERKLVDARDAYNMAVRAYMNYITAAPHKLAAIIWNADIVPLFDVLMPDVLLALA